MKRPPKQIFGWLGFRKDPTNHTTISTLFLMANYISLLCTVDRFLIIEEKGNTGAAMSLGAAISYLNEHKEIVGIVPAMTTGLALFAALTLLLSLVSFFCIRYPDPETRWGARLLVSILPFVATAYVVWGALA